MSDDVWVYGGGGSVDGGGWVGVVGGRMGWVDGLE